MWRQPFLLTAWTIRRFACLDVTAGGNGWPWEKDGKERQALRRDHVDNEG